MEYRISKNGTTYFFWNVERIFVHYRYKIYLRKNIFDRISLSVTMRIGNIDTKTYELKIGSTEFGTIRTILDGCL